mgnify:FL=1
MKDKKAITIKTLTKSNVWDIQENDVFRMWEAATKDSELKDNMRHFIDIIKTAFEIEEVKVDKPVVIDKLEQRGFKVGTITIDEQTKQKVAIKKRAILRVTDLTYENVGHISAAKLVEVLDRNFGGGWESLPQSVQDIIESAFDISTTTLPADRLHKTGGLYDKKVNDGYEVLEIPKGSWTEAIFVKEKPEEDTKPVIETQKPSSMDFNGDEDEDKDEDLPKDDDKHDEDEDNDDAFDDDKLTEESYRTTYETNPDELNYEAEEISDDSEGDY